MNNSTKRLYVWVHAPRNSQLTPALLTELWQGYENFFGLCTPRLLIRLLLLIACLVCSVKLLSQETTKEIDKIFNWASPDMPGCVCAVSQNGELLVNRAYGSADIERKVPLSINSVFDIASVRKQFIAAATLLLAEERLIALSDNIRKYFPELPEYASKISIDHLLTHTSGIRDWTALTALAEGEAELLGLILKQRAINFEPGEEWSYSNSGYVLLTELVSRASGKPFGEFVRTRMFEPLGMHSTSYGEDPLAPINNRALAYEKDGNSWRLGVLVGKERGKGSGGIFTTASDLMIWSNAIITGKLSKFVSEKLQEPAILNNGRKLSYGRGMNVNNYSVGKLISHSGDGGGYSAWLGLLPQKNLSIAVLCNFNPVSATKLGQQVAQLFLRVETAAAPPASGKVEEMDQPDLSSKSGLFFSEMNGNPLQLAAQNGQLRIVNGPVLATINKNQFRNPNGSLFFMSQDEFNLYFKSPNEIELITKEGKLIAYRRATPFSPSDSILQAFSGTYYNDEVNASFLVNPGKGGLDIGLKHLPGKSFHFKPVHPDIFQFSAMFIKFRRNNSGNLIGFDFSNPLLRKLEFRLVKDK